MIIGERNGRSVVKKENNEVFTYGQLEELRNNLAVSITEDESYEKDCVLRKYYKTCSSLNTCSLTRPLIDGLKHRPIATRFFVFKLWNELVDLCVNVCSTMVTDDVKSRGYESEYCGFLSTKIEAAQYIHVLNDMISVNDYTTIQDEALQFAIDTIKEKYNGERKEK